MRVDHICFSVTEINEGIRFWTETFGYSRMTEVITNSIQKVKVTFLMKKDSITIKLIQPIDDITHSMNFAGRGGGFHHICFRCDNLDAAISELSGKGMKLLVPPQPGEAFNNREIAFMMSKNGLNVELIDTDEKAGHIKIS